MDVQGIQCFVREVKFRDIVRMTFKSKTFFGNDKIKERTGYVVNPISLGQVWLSKKDPITDYPLRYRPFRYKAVYLSSIVSYEIL